MEISTSPRLLVAIFCFVGLVGSGCESAQQREMEQHQTVLRGLLDRKPTIEQVEREVGLQPYRVVRPGDAREIRGLWTNPLNSPDEVEKKVGQWPETRIYLKSSMVYLIHFDEAGTMRDFSCLAN